jgi:hypothetical protein
MTRNFLLAGVVGLAAATTASAALQISVTGFDFGYDGDAIFDQGGAGFNGIEDELISADFFVDGSLIGSLSLADDITLNTFFEGVTNIPVAGGLATSTASPTSANFFDLSFDGGLDFLFTDISSVQVFYSGGEIGVTGVTSSVDIFNQDLPFDLEIDASEPVSVSFSGLITDLEDDGTFVTSFEASGTAEVRGQLIPEPTSLALVGLGGLTMLRRRR